MFNCDGCGECCKHTGHLKELPSLVDQCLFLGKRNLCLVYEDRPFVCRVDDIYEAMFKDKMSLQEFYDWTHSACDKLKGTV